MNNYEIIISLLSLAGVVILILSLGLFSRNNRHLNKLGSENSTGLPKIIFFHYFLFIVFIISYFTIFCCFILNIQVWFEILVGFLLFFGALFVYMAMKLNKAILKNAARKYEKAFELNRDLAEEHQDALISEKKYRSILENMEESYFEVDLNGSLMFFNDSACRILEYPREELMGMNFKAFQTEDSVDRVFKVYNNLYKLGSGQDFVEYPVMTKHGKKKFVDTSISLLLDNEGKPVGFSGLARDITGRKEAEKKQKQLEAQFVQAQKLEAIGHLAGGITHDFNNILTAIAGNAKVLLRDKASLNEKNLKSLENIISATERAGALINQVLTFSRRNEETLYPVRFDLILKEAVRFIRSTTTTSIDINTNINTEDYYILADSTQIHQVIMNLCTNAKYAMEKQNHGTIDINLTPVVLDNFTGIAGNVLKGTYFELIVKDTGEGMTPDALGKIFNPFFTTRGQGKGTGLGLSTVHGIVKSCNGDIKVESEPGKGTTFKIYLPVTDKGKQEKENILSKKVKGKGTILFLDDEDWITDSFSELFADYGYHVDTFNSSEKALQAVEESDKDYYDVVVTDFQMPRMNGLEFAERLKHINDKIAVIICSGDLTSIPEGKSKNINVHALIQKPFDDDKLAAIIQEAIDKKQN